jgi:hypothetical protein
MAVAKGLAVLSGAGAAAVNPVQAAIDVQRTTESTSTRI